jgi:hypothetical protein
MDIFDLALNLDVDYLPAYPLQRHSAPRSGFLLHSVPVFSACSSPAWFLLLAEDLLDIRLRRTHTHTHTQTNAPSGRTLLGCDHPCCLLCRLPGLPACFFSCYSGHNDPWTTGSILRTIRTLRLWLVCTYRLVPLSPCDGHTNSRVESKLMMPCLLFLASVSSLFFKWANERLN